MHESRIDVPILKLDVLSRNLRTLTGPAMNTFSSRRSEFDKVERPDLSHYHTQKYL